MSLTKIVFRRPESLSLPAVGTLMAVACGSPVKPSVEAADPISSGKPHVIQVLPRIAAISSSDTVRFRAVAQDNQGNELTGVDFSWETGDTSVAIVRQDGLATGRRPGVAMLLARAGVVLGSAHLQVNAPPAPPPPPPPPPPAPPPPPPLENGAVLVGAGDIASCTVNYDEATAKLLDSIPGTVFTAGDNIYGGSLQEFEDCYGPSWGRHRHRTLPAPGNREYRAPEGKGYFEYFGATAGESGRGYYSVELGGWHILVLNSYLPFPDRREQAAWVRQEIVARASRCTLAIWHHPRFSGDMSSERMAEVWEILYQAGAELVISGHAHNYQRLAPMDPTGRPDPLGVRQFVAGTGGHGLGGLWRPPPAASEASYKGGHGVLKLTLRPDSYDWEFIPVSGRSFTDRGTESCR